MNIYHKQLYLMNQFIVSLKEEVHTLLDELDKNETDILKKARQGVSLLENTIDRMKAFVLNYTFKNAHEEITFFKDIKLQRYVRYAYQGAIRKVFG